MFKLLFNWSIFFVIQIVLIFRFVDVNVCEEIIKNILVVVKLVECVLDFIDSNVFLVNVLRIFGVFELNCNVLNNVGMLYLVWMDFCFLVW